MLLTSLSKRQKFSEDVTLRVTEVSWLCPLEVERLVDSHTEGIEKGQILGFGEGINANIESATFRHSFQKKG